MIINKHGSFYIRNSWPTKILATLQDDTHLFSPNRELHAVDNLGVGRVMVKAMRYWSTVLGLSTERHDSNGVLTQLTSLGESIYKYDRFMESKGVLWLLHRNLVQNIDNATAWYWAYNVFNKKNFSKKEFVDAFFAYLTNSGLSYEKKIVAKEFDCFKNTYVSSNTYDLKRIIDEDTTPFFAPLHMITSLGNGCYEFNSPNYNDIDVDVFLYCIFQDNNNENRQISIEYLLEEPEQVGKYMNISFETMMRLLQKAENKGYITLVNNFGNRYIEKGDISSSELLKYYFSKMGA